MKKYPTLLLLILALITGACTDKYKCKCIDNSQMTITQGSIPGLSFTPANIVAPEHWSWFSIVADNSSKTWDNITVKLFDSDRTYLDIADGIKYMHADSDLVYNAIPITSVKWKGEPVLGELSYSCNFFLGENSVLFTGSIGLVSCDNFTKSFEYDDCRWSCPFLNNGFEPGHCLSGCPL